MKLQEALLDLAVLAWFALLVDARRQFQMRTLPPYRCCAWPGAQFFRIKHAVANCMSVDAARESCTLRTAEP